MAKAGVLRDGTHGATRSLGTDPIREEEGSRLRPGWTMVPLAAVRTQEKVRFGQMRWVLLSMLALGHFSDFSDKTRRGSRALLPGQTGWAVSSMCTESESKRAGEAPEGMWGEKMGIKSKDL